MTKYKNKTKDIHVTNHIVNARVKILENENIMIQNMVVTSGQGSWSSIKVLTLLVEKEKNDKRLRNFSDDLVSANHSIEGRGAT